MTHGPVLALLLAAAASTLVPSAAEANWLTKALENAGDAGRGVSRTTHGLHPDLDHAFTHLKNLPEKPGSASLAAEVGHEGHWRFINSKGEIFTAATPDELARLREALLPGSSGPLTLYLTPRTVFDSRALLGDLPADAELFIAPKSGAYRLQREKVSEIPVLTAEVRPNLRVRLDNEAVFNEILFQIGQPLKVSGLRVLALETGSPDALTAVPKFDAATRMALVDTIDPARLTASFKRIRGQTVVLTGRLDNGALSFLDAGGGPGTLSMDALRSAAREADVNLIIVKSETPRQPGGKNWLWQTTTIPGLDHAVKQPLFGDFLAAIGNEGPPLTITGGHAGNGRVVLDVIPPPSAGAPLTDSITGWIDSLAGEAMANIAISGLELDLRDENRQRELDLRIIPGVPATVQISYLAAMVMGLFGLGTAWKLWARIWPAEDREDYASYPGYVLAQGTRGLIFVLLFLPLVGLPMFLRYIAFQIWALVTAPLRALRWIRDRLRPTAA